MSVIVKGGGGAAKQEKTVTAGTGIIEVSPDTGKLLSKVVVNPTPSQTKEVTAGTGDTTVSPDSGKLLSGVTVHPTPSHTKTVTAGTSNTTVSPDSGKLLSGVTVQPTPSQSKTVSPSTSQQTVSPDSGKLLSSVVVNAMPSGALSDITVSSAGLITAQVGTSGYLASGTSKTKQLTTQAAKTWTPGTSDQTISSGMYLTGLQTIKGDSDLIAENIREGIDIFGVLGTMAEGIAFENISRFTKVAVDTFTFASDQNLSSNITLTHSLGVKPQVVLLFSKTKPDIRNCIVEMLQSAVGTYAYEELNRVTTHVSTGAFMLETTQVVASTSWIPTSSLVKLPDESSYFLGAGLEYTLITMA